MYLNNGFPPNLPSLQGLRILVVDNMIRQVRTKARERGKEVLAIAVTAQATEETRQRALSVGFDLWFTKPLNFGKFVAVLGCLAICQQSSYAIAQRILGNVPRHGDLSLEKQLHPICPS